MNELVNPNRQEQRSHRLNHPWLSLLLTAGLAACAPTQDTTTTTSIGPGAGGNHSVSSPGGGGAGGFAELPMNTTRRLLHEEFGGSNCGPCAKSEVIVFDVLAAHPEQYVLLAYQLGSDPYVTTEAVKRRMGYLPPEAETYSVPYMHVDGVHGFHPVEINNSAGYQTSDFASFDTPSPLELSASHSLDGQTITVDITMRVLSDVPSQNLRLHVAIIENLTSKNVGTNGQTKFHAVMKKMVPDHYGQALAALSRGQEQNLSASYTFQGDYTSETSFSDHVNHAVEHTVEEFEDLSAVVFIQDAVTKQVHQSAWTGADSGASQIAD